MTGIDPRLGPTTQRRSSVGIVWGSLAIAGLVPAFILSGLLALNIDEYQNYSASVAEYGDTAASNADEAKFGIQICSFLLTILWLLITGIAAAIAAKRHLPVLRTALFVGGGLALFVGLMLFLGLTIGTVPIGQL